MINELLFNFFNINPNIFSFFKNSEFFIAEFFYQI